MKINGSLVFDASSASEVQNLRLEKLASLPSWSASYVGRVVFLTTTNVIYYGDAGSAAWMPIATGGSAFAQVEGDNLEAALGAGINSADGTFNAAAFPAQAGLSSPSSFTNAINQIAAYATANNTLYELDDVVLTSATPAAGKFLMFNGTNAVDHTLILSDVSDVTTTVAELNELHLGGAVTADFVKLHAVTASAADLSLLTGGAAGTGAYLAGPISATLLSFLGGATPVTSSIQTQLNGKQALDADLTAISALAGTGIAVRTAADSWATRTLQAPAAGFTISNPAGLTGDPTFALANDLAAYEGLGTTGYVVRTGDGTATTRALVGTAGRIAVTNGDGVASDTSIDLITVSNSLTGTFQKLAIDTYGRVTGTTAVVASDITSLVDSTYVNVAGDTMTGNLVMASGTYITLTSPALLASDAVNKAYVDAISTGLSWKQAVRAASTAPLTLSTGFAAGQVVDGYTLVLGDRILVKDQAAPAENGIYIVTAGAPTRAGDMDTAAEFDGAAVLIQEGSTQADFGFTQTNTVVTIGTDPVHFNQFTGSSVLTAGVGLEQVANVLNVRMGAGVVQLPTGEVGIDLYNAAGGNLALILTTDGSTHSTASGAQLFLLLDTGGALQQTSAGLKIGAAQVTNAMLQNSFITLNTDSSTSQLALGDTFEIRGTSARGIRTSNVADVVTLSIDFATSSQAGVATFNTASFDVSLGGDVTIKTAGVSNAQLANSTITFAGSDASSDAVALGETLSFADVTGGHAGGALILSSVAANVVTLSARQAGIGTLGVASFGGSQFTVSAGAVTIAHTLGQGAITNVATSVDAPSDKDLFTYDSGTSKWKNATRAAVLNTESIDSLADVAVTSPAAGQVLSWDGTNWINKKMYHVEAVGSAATTWVVNHGLSVKFVNVTILDSTDNVIIPQSIVMTTGTTTVTFNTAVAGTAVIMGIA